MEEHCVFCEVRATTVYSYIQKINFSCRMTEFSPEAFCMCPNTGLLKDILNMFQHSYLNTVCAGDRSSVSPHVAYSLCTVLMNKHCLCNWQNSTKLYLISSCLHRASTVSKHFFTNPTDAHNYNITGMLKTIKIPTIAPTCFGSLRNHHQGATPCLAKTTIMVLLCSSLTTWSMSWRHISLLRKRAVPHVCTTG